MVKSAEHGKDGALAVMTTASMWGLMRALLLGALAVGCSSATTGGANTAPSSGAGTQFASQMCSKLTTCSISVTNCSVAFSAIVLSSSCQGDLANASCADLNASPLPASLAGCFPTCTGNATCNSNGTITECVNGSQYVYSCTGLCAGQSKTYSGTCSTVHNGQTSATGHDTCWCN